MRRWVTGPAALLQRAQRRGNVTRRSGKAGAPVYSLPSVMTSSEFVTLVRRQTNVLVERVVKEKLEGAAAQRSRAFDAEIRDKVCEQFAALRHISEKEVRSVSEDEYGYKDERLVTCLVPYQVAVNIILRRLPLGLRNEAARELRDEEKGLAEGSEQANAAATSPTPGPRQNRLIQWEERDVFVGTGLPPSGSSQSSRSWRQRIPVWAVMGHVNHGKTTLIDTVQQTFLVSEETSGISQSIRAFTIPLERALDSQPRGELRETQLSTLPISHLTFIDTPGHHLFAEMRFHAHIATDYVLLVVAADEGIQGQTVETVKVALNADKPIVVAINKIDIFTDPRRAKSAVANVVDQLAGVGLYVQLIFSEKNLAHFSTATNRQGKDSASWSVQDAASLSSDERHERQRRERETQVFRPMKSQDPLYAGSLKSPVLNLTRKCLGVCISAAKGTNVALLLSVLKAAVLASPPKTVHCSPEYKALPCTVQAVVLESSKHLFDEESYRVNRRKQVLQKLQEAAARRRSRKFERNSIPVKVHSAMAAPRNKARSANPTSSSTLVLSVIVKQGSITRGMPFVADQSEGIVEHMMDFWGNPVSQAPPGMAVTLIDRHSTAGCPGACAHALSMPSPREAKAVQCYRTALQWFVECFPTRLASLKPRGRDVSFRHLGDYGQLQNTTSVEYQLLYGPPPLESTTSKAGEQALSCGDGTAPTLAEGVERSVQPAPPAATFGQLMVDKNAEAAVAFLASIASSEGGKRQSYLAIESAWASLRPTTPPSSRVEFEAFEKQRIHLGVLLKVDSWHSARMFYREVGRLGTSKVSFTVVGVRFGALTVDDILFFSTSVKVVVCFRTPQATAQELENYLETLDTWYIETDQFIDATVFLKACAVELHHEQVGE